jgi:charged multivesicular body protein 3
MEEMMNDAVDSALDSEDIEEEIEEEVDKVLTELAGETASALPDAVRKEKLKQPSTSQAVDEVCTILIIVYVFVTIQLADCQIEQEQ